jgi:hypothetical protein
MANRKKARGKKGKKKRFLRTGNDIQITPKQRKQVLDTLDGLQKDAEDIALEIREVRDFLCKVDFCGR